NKPRGNTAMNAIDLAGRAAVVTGGAQGIGFAVASRLRQSGARVALWDVDEATMDAAVQALGGPEHVRAVCTDVTHADSVEAAAQHTERAFGAIDVLVHSAGIAGT